MDFQIGPSNNFEGFIVIILLSISGRFGYDLDERSKGVKGSFEYVLVWMGVSGEIFTFLLSLSRKCHDGWGQM